MTLSVATVLRESLRRLATGPALLLLLALAVAQTLGALLAGPVYRIAPAALAGAGDLFRLVLEPVSLVALALVCVVAGYVGVVTIRVFATEWGVVEREHLTRAVAKTLANWLAGALVLFVCVAVGLVVLVVPGLFVLAVFLLALPFVAVEDANAATALRRSFRATEGHRTTLLALAVAVLVVDTLLFVVSVAVVAALSGALAPLGLFVGTLAVAVGFVFLWITMARAYASLDGTPA